MVVTGWTGIPHVSTATQHPGDDHERYRALRTLAPWRIAIGRRVPPAWRRGAAVLVGGMIGGAGRLALAVLDAGHGFPWGTLAANLSGAFVLGYLLTRFTVHAPRTSLAIPLLCTGVLGSYTTFSAFSLEVWRLVEAGRPAVALGYGGGSVVAGLLVAAAGIRLAEARP